MKRVTKLIMSFALLVGIVAMPLVPVNVMADNTTPIDSIKSGVGAASGNSSTGTADEFNKQIKNVINFILFILGIAAVIMIILGGFRYVTSNGDSGQVTSAKNTIMYAVIGLVIAIIAFAIVNFVISAFSKTTS